MNGIDGLHSSAKITSGVQGILMGSADTLPAPSAELSGITVLYTGSDESLVHGALYQCDGSAWNKVTSTAVPFVEVDSLPQESEAKANCIYSIPSGDKRREFYLLNGAWEELGGYGGSLDSGMVFVNVVGDEISDRPVTVVSSSAQESGATGEDGVLSFALDADTDYLVSVIPAEGFKVTEPQTVRVGALERKDLTFIHTKIEPATLTVTVVDGIGAGNEVGRRIDVTGNSDVTRYTEDEGTASFTLLPGTYVVASDTTEGYFDVESETVELAEGAQVDVTLYLNAYPRIRVTIVDNSDSGAESRVQVYYKNGTLDSSSVLTDEDGTVLIAVKTEGKYVVTPIAPENYVLDDPSKKVQTTANTTSEVTFELNRYPLIHVTITGEYDETSLRFHGPNGFEYPDSVIENGKVTRFVKAIGKYRITLADAPVGRHCHAVYVRTDWNGEYEAVMEIRDHFIWGFQIDESVDDPFSNVTYLYDNVNFEPMSMGEDGVFDVGSWDTCPILEKIKPCVIAPDGTKTYLDREDITLTEDKQPAPTGLGYDYMVEFPKTAVHVSKEGSVLTVVFTDWTLEEAKAQTGKDFTYWNFQWDGQEYDYFYLGQFLAHNESGKTYSHPGMTPTDSVSMKDFIKTCQARGAGYDMLNWSKMDYVSALFTLFFRSTDGQSALGLGLSDGTSKATVSARSYDNYYGMAGSLTDATQSMSFLWLNDWWGNLTQWVGGAGTVDYNMWYADKSVDTIPTDTTDSHGIIANSLTGNVTGYVRNMQGHPKGIFFPTLGRGTATTGYADWGTVLVQSVPDFGGYWAYGTRCGPFSVDIYDESGDSESDITGTRLMYSAGLPENPNIWGFEIDQDVDSPSDRVTYIGRNKNYLSMSYMDETSKHSPRDWVGDELFESIRPCILMDDGKYKYYLDKSSMSVIGASWMGETVGYDYMVEFPKVGVRVTNSGSKLKVEFTTMPEEEAIDQGFTYWNFQWDGKEYDHFYIGQNLAYVEDSKCYSSVGSMPTVNLSLEDFMAACKARGEGFDVGMWNKYDYLSALYTLFFKSTDGQSALAGGYITGSEIRSNSIRASFDNLYPCGMAGKPGNISQSMAFLWIWNYWGNVYQWLGGMGTDSSFNMWYSDVSTITVPTTTNASQGIVKNDKTSYITGFVSKEQGDPKGIFFPAETGATKTTKYCDNGHIASSKIPYFGGYWGNSSDAGPYHLYLLYTAKTAYAEMGARLQYSGDPVEIDLDSILRIPLTVPIGLDGDSRHPTALQKCSLVITTSASDGSQITSTDDIVITFTSKETSYGTGMAYPGVWYCIQDVKGPAMANFEISKVPDLIIGSSSAYLYFDVNVYVKLPSGTCTRRVDLLNASGDAVDGARNIAFEGSESKTINALGPWTADSPRADVVLGTTMEITMQVPLYAGDSEPTTLIGCKMVVETTPDSTNAPASTDPITVTFTASDIKADYSGLDMSDVEGPGEAKFRLENVGMDVMGWGFDPAMYILTIVLPDGNCTRSFKMYDSKGALLESVEGVPFTTEQNQLSYFMDLTNKI